jgi:trehalose-6-phosphate synthase
MFWPLCHIVHVRPTFRPDDWNMYRAVNERFAMAVLEEVQGRRAVVWVQDFHLALLPRLLREARPDLIIGHFWHIPWPNPEAFRICPWKQEILEGLLGADVLGFHIRYHCDNFLRLWTGIQEQVDALNAKYGTANWEPIHYLARPIYHPNILAYLARADLCIVSALHDGMNLVAKEFIAAQPEESPGVLILSQFTGAARELHDALLMNPYNVAGFAEAIRCAVEMPLEERRERCRLQVWVREHDIYRWAHAALREMSQVRQHA